jgi:hypothetical protein
VPRADNPSTLVCRLSRNSGALTSRTPQGHVGLFRGYFTFYWRTQRKSSARIANAPAEVRNFSLPNTKQKIFVSTFCFEYEKKNEGQIRLTCSLRRRHVVGLFNDAVTNFTVVLLLQVGE